MQCDLLADPELRLEYRRTEVRGAAFRGVGPARLRGKRGALAGRDSDRSRVDHGTCTHWLIFLNQPPTLPAPGWLCFDVTASNSSDATPKRVRTMQRLQRFRRPIIRAGSSIALAAMSFGYAQPANAFFFGLGGLVDAIWGVGEAIIGHVEPVFHGLHEFQFPGHWDGHDPWFDHLEEEVFVRDDVPPACADYQRAQGCWGTDDTHRIYQKAVAKGRKFVLERWAEQESCSELEAFAEAINQELMQQQPRRHRPKKLCRFGGFSDGMMEALEGIRERCKISCADDGRIIGKVSAGVYCSLSQVANGFEKASDYVRGPVKLCGQAFQDSCDNSFISEAKAYENANGSCKEYTEGQYAEIFDRYRNDLCIFNIGGDPQDGHGTGASSHGTGSTTGGEAGVGAAGSTDAHTTADGSSTSSGAQDTTSSAEHQGMTTGGVADESSTEVQESTSETSEDASSTVQEETSESVVAVGHESSTSEETTEPAVGGGDESSSAEAESSSTGNEADSTESDRGVLASESGPDLSSTQEEDASEEDPEEAQAEENAASAPLGGPFSLLLLGFGMTCVGRRRRDSQRG